MQHAAQVPGRTVLVKIGGSALTVKSQYETLKSDMLEKTAQDIASAVRHGVRLVVVHGAGSFGHGDARRYRVKAGFHVEEEHASTSSAPAVDASARPSPAEPAPWQRTFGFAQVRRSVTRLNHYVVEALVRAGVPAVAMPPFPSWETNNGAVVAHPLDKVLQALETGLVPVLHGDAVLDRGTGCTILSGDTILFELASAVRPSSAAFLTDVAGVFDQPPGTGGSFEGASLIREIAVDASGKAELPPTANDDQHDVTGGMQTKLEAAASVAAQGLPVHIVEVGTPSATAALAGHEPSVRTRIALRG